MLDGLGTLRGFLWWSVGVRYEAGAIECFRAAHQGSFPQAAEPWSSLSLEEASGRELGIMHIKSERVHVSLCVSETCVHMGALCDHCW
jgi:hypothetical protein